MTAKCEAKREPLVAWLLTSVVAEVALAEAVTEAFPGPYYPGPQAETSYYLNCERAFY